MVLHLTLHRQWFDEVASGIKKIEYREIKPYWERRLDGHQFSEIHFRNGYRADSPLMQVECLGIVKNGRYEIHLGKILKTINYAR